MENLKRLLPVEKSKKDVRKTVLTNIVKMLATRGVVGNNRNSIIKDLVGKVDSDGILNMDYKFKLDKEVVKKYGKHRGEDLKWNSCVIKIVPQQITAINKSSEIASFLNKNKGDKRIVVVNSIGKKAVQFVKQNHSDAEVFSENELMINLVDVYIVPKHTMLDHSDVENFYKTYNVKKKQMPRIMTGDPVARYYNMRPGDITRILRPNEASGVVSFYRLVVAGDIKVKK